ncbi:heparanase [Brienomyrus brachyistius]|uniref:heparanase n=1 Tax=Brienomyrus brachyistius TaxID=42636 RepID=UPI0020B27129|nr:heparanase [Brienomyrus brachyistius]XP_048876215.1 heparanase [Brienomyrus brachyistius]XP_048876216.1 heparanase [Brienomyrus brachyistius]
MLLLRAGVTMLVALIFLAVLREADLGGHEAQVVHISADFSRVRAKVNQRFLSVAIDSNLATEEKFMKLLRSQKLRTLAQALSPAFLRFGGNKQDFMVFNPDEAPLDTPDFPRGGPSAGAAHPCDGLVLPADLEESLKQDWPRQQLLLQEEETVSSYGNIKFSGDAMDLLYTFANCSGFDLIFGLNAVLRTKANEWDSRNAETLLAYCEQKGYNMSWELGNEPNSYLKKAGIRLDGHQLGEDFMHLHRILQASRLYRDARLYGPDISQPRGHRMDLLEKFLKSGAEAINACTWHHYYVNGKETSLQDFLDPNVLDSLMAKTNEVLQIVDHVSPGKKVWLGETSSAYGGGATGLSDRFLAGFMWLDKLGLAAKLGLDVVIRQVLIGAGKYHLVDNNLDPVPDYWLSVLHKRLVGSEVLDAAFSSGVQNGRLRVYLHCTRRDRPDFRSGSVTLFALNLDEAMVQLALPHHVANSSAQAFVLEAGGSNPGKLQSRSVRLNGKVLKMVNDTTLPPLLGTTLPPGQPLRLPGYSFAFWVLKDAGAPACS